MIVRSLIFLFLFFSLPLMAWDDGGHELVAYLAYARLNPKAKSEVDRLTPQMIGPYEQPYNPYTIACWMDDLRGRSTHLSSLGLFKPWHFIDLGLDAQDPQPEFQPGSDNETEGNIVQALKRVEVVLRGGTDPYVSNQAMACAMAIHLVGDIHQPLHAATQYYRNSSGRLVNDRGGNRLYLTNPSREGSRLNLHSFWDSAWRADFGDDGSLLLDHRYLDSRTHGNPNIYTLAETWRHDAPDMGTDLSFLPEAWARESNHLAKEYVYADLLPGERRNQVYLTQAYVRMARTLAQHQLVLAAFRLAELLNTTLGGTSPSSPPPSFPAGPPRTDVQEGP